MEYDIVINNGLVVYGNLEKTREKINIGIVNDRIVKLSFDSLKGKEVIDAQGKIVAPGFIDPHCHSDLSAFFNFDMTSKIYQGVTTEINGNCGIGIVPIKEPYSLEMKEYIKDHFILPEFNFNFENFSSLNLLKNELNKRKAITNQGYLIGTGCIRIAVSGFKPSKLTTEELNNMLQILKEELEAGALGVSFGLVYQPGNFMKNDEIIEIMKVVAQYDKVASFHMRDEGENILFSIEEVLECAKKSRCKTNISHLKIMNKTKWGESKKILELLEKAKQEGVDISYDQYPYLATSTTLMVLLPEEIFTGDIEKFINNIKSLTLEEKNNIYKNIQKRGGAENILISNCSLAKDFYSGKTLSQLEKELSLNPVDIVLMLIEKTHGRAKVIYFSMCEDDLNNFMKGSLGVIGSDGSSIPVNENKIFGKPHPRNFATFPKFIKLNREKKIFSIEEMINRITKKTADIYSIKDRGEIKEGNFADITIFDYDKIEDNSTFENPFILPEGIEYVIINGKIVVDKREYTGMKAGIFI